MAPGMRGGGYLLLAFASTHAAMEAQRALSARLPVTVMPTLRQITAACGISLRVEARDQGVLAAALAEGAVPPGDFRLYWVQDGTPRPWPPTIEDQTEEGMRCP